MSFDNSADRVYSGRELANEWRLRAYEERLKAYQNRKQTEPMNKKQARYEIANNFTKFISRESSSLTSRNIIDYLIGGKRFK